MDWTPLVAFAVPLVISAVLTALLLRWAPHLGLVDLPGARKVHTLPTPRAGGLAIYAAVVAGAVLLTVLNVPFAGRELALDLGLGFVIVLLGVLDDRYSLSWKVRLSVQFAVALVLGVVYFTVAALYVWAVAFWIVALINAFNMLDNMDALSAGVAWIAAAVFAAALLLRQAAWDWAPALPFLLLLGALTGFLWFNRPPARIFMGDGGSTFLGYFLAVRSLHDDFLDVRAWPTWLVPVCVLAVPCYDLATVVALRLWQKRSPFHADKQHLSHRLVALGLSSPRAVGVIYLLALASGLTGLVLPHVSQREAVLLVAQLGVCWLAVAAVEYVRFFRRDPMGNTEKEA